MAGAGFLLHQTKKGQVNVSAPNDAILSNHAGSVLSCESEQLIERLTIASSFAIDLHRPSR
jgi:hypothetical protein